MDRGRNDLGRWRWSAPVRGYASPTGIMQLVPKTGDGPTDGVCWARPEMSGAEGRWAVPPGAITPRTTFPLVESGRVVGLGAICDLRPRRFDAARSQSFSVSEFATLQDGRRVILHEARGFTIGWGSGDSWEHMPMENMTRSVLNVVLPDDDEGGEDHPWSWLADLARARGLDVTAEVLRGLPYEIVFTDTVREHWLAPD